jgi:SAM-dependent methyltransferase
LKECSKSIQRRLGDSNFVRRYFVGAGLDVGGKPDPLSLYQELFPLMDEVRTWDWDDGDAQFLNGLKDSSFDFVHSSHCLEHLVDPRVGLTNWFRVVRDDGYVIVTVPDEDLYEQGVFPSTFNLDHKWTFTIWKAKSWSHRSINLIDLIRHLGAEADVVRMEQLSASFRFQLPRYDQTLTPVAECGIELIIRKRPPKEIEFGGRCPVTSGASDREMRVHLNQYRDDLRTLKGANQELPPFTNDTPL